MHREGERYSIHYFGGCVVGVQKSVVLFLLTVLLIGGCRFEESGPQEVTPPGSDAVTPVGEVSQNLGSQSSGSQDPFSISDAPFAGTINGVPVSGFTAFLDDGTFLKIYTGEDPDFEYGTRLLVFTDLTSPENQRVRFDRDNGFQAWHVHFDSKENEHLSHMFAGELLLEFQTGTEKDYRVPASLKIVATGDFPVKLEGFLVMATSGLVSRDGVVDLSHDHKDTVAYVGQQHVMQEHASAKIEFFGPQGQLMQHELSDSMQERGFIQKGYYSALYSVEGGPTQIEKMQIGKKDGQWQVIQVLAENQISEAHPMNPLRSDSPPYIYREPAAKEFESTIYAEQGGWRKIKEPLSFSCGGGQRKGDRGFCRVPYGVYQGEAMEEIKCSEVTYLFDQVAGKWHLTETLPAGKKWNFRTNTVEDRKDDIWGC